MELPAGDAARSCGWVRSTTRPSTITRTNAAAVFEVEVPVPPEELAPEPDELLAPVEVDVVVDVVASGSQVCVTVEHVLTAGLQQPATGGLHALSGMHPPPARQKPVPASPMMGSQWSRPGRSPRCCGNCCRSR